MFLDLLGIHSLATPYFQTSAKGASQNNITLRPYIIMVIRFKRQDISWNTQK